MAILIDNIYYTYKDGTEALKGLSLYIGKGEKVALLGLNGAGKSTLLLHLNGIFLPREGKISILGKELNAKTEKWARTKVGIVFQDPDDQVFSSSVWEDVAFGPRNMGLSEEEIKQRVFDSLVAVGMLEHCDKAPYRLSYGQKKRVAIAGILAMQPEIIVLDEPMAFLDPMGKDTLTGLLDLLHKQGKTIVIATHDVDFAAEWANRVIIIKDGRTLVQGGTGLLQDAGIMEDAGLRLPAVSNIFSKVSEVSFNPLPLTVAQAVAIIRKLVNKRG